MGAFTSIMAKITHRRTNLDNAVLFMRRIATKEKRGSTNIHLLSLGIEL